jgi:hypothetical protein
VWSSGRPSLRANRFGRLGKRVIARLNEVLDPLLPTGRLAPIAAQGAQLGGTNTRDSQPATHDVLREFSVDHGQCPGLQTPLGWTSFTDPCERGVRRGLRDLGGFTSSELEVPDTVDDRLLAIFYGRCAGGVDALRKVMDRIPGVDRTTATVENFAGLWRRAASTGPTIRMRIWPTRPPSRTCSPRGRSLTLPMCSPVSDGGAAVIVCSPELASRGQSLR